MRNHPIVLRREYSSFNNSFNGIPGDFRERLQQFDNLNGPKLLVMSNDNGHITGFRKILDNKQTNARNIINQGKDMAKKARDMKINAQVVEKKARIMSKKARDMMKRGKNMMHTLKKKTKRKKQTNERPDNKKRVNKKK